MLSILADPGKYQAPGGGPDTTKSKCPPPPGDRPAKKKRRIYQKPAGRGSPSTSGFWICHDSLRRVAYGVVATIVGRIFPEKATHTGRAAKDGSGTS